MILEPGRSLVARAGVTLYTVGSVKRAAAGTTWVAVDGGISDNPRPALYGARYTALLANRAGEPPAGPYAVAGKHCESGDLLIERVELPEPRRGDVLAVPRPALHARDELDLQRRAAARRRARPRRRGDADPPPRDDRRPARARGLERSRARAAVGTATCSHISIIPRTISNRAATSTPRASHRGPGRSRSFSTAVAKRPFTTIDVMRPPHGSRECHSARSS